MRGGLIGVGGKSFDKEVSAERKAVEWFPVPGRNCLQTP